jgi:hypothetical protein
MSGRSKFSAFRPWVQPSLSKKTNGDKLRFLTSSVGGVGEERQANIKLAWFFALVALLFVLVNHLGRVKDQKVTNLGPDSLALVNLTLSPPGKSGDRAGFSVRFRLSNKGNHPVFYPLRAGTNVPIGQLVGRTSPSSEWMSLSGTSKQQVPAVQEPMDSNLMWIEMPPGGWVDGEFYDAGESPEEHAYVIYVKLTRDADGSRIISQFYTSSAN